MEETFTYDDLNRLTGITLKRPSGQDLHCAVTYDALGRMTSKQAVTSVNGTPQVTTSFSLPSFDATKVHAMTQAQTSAGLFSSSAQTLTYTGFDKVSTLRQGNDRILFTYGYDHQRIGMQKLTPETSQAKDYVGSCEFITRSFMGGTDTKSLTYLSGPYGVFAVVESHNGTETLHYILKDNLGSWVTITDANGIAEQQMSFDAWGNRRDPQTWANYTNNDAFEEPMFDRGFTGHEHLYSFGFINMNGRMYDPVMSSFLSADRYVQDPMTAMGFNRYAYCMYNPLRFVDPTGWRPIGGGRGYTPNSSANAFDPYMFYGGRIPLEPRDLGLRELSTADPIITWMEENSLHGSSGNGSEPIIDPSNLTPSQKKAFESTVAYLTEHSPLFKILYNSLSDSEINYVLIIGETSDNLPAQYNLKDNSIIFRDDEALISILAVSEEMFHAYQLSENKSLYNSKEFNFEFEAKVAVFFIVNQLDIGYQNAEGTNFEKMNSFLTSNGLDVVVPPAHYIQTPFFLNGYKEGADYFQAWNLRNNYGNTNYKKATLQAPKSLFKLFTPFKP